MFIKNTHSLSKEERQELTVEAYTENEGKILKTLNGDDFLKTVNELIETQKTINNRRNYRLEKI